MSPRKPKDHRALTDVELELMTVLWKRRGATVHEVQGDLPPERKLAYTSISTVLRILEQKGFVASEKLGRGHRYLPVIAKEDYEARSVEQLVSRLFDDSPAALVRRLVETKHLSEKELSEIRELLDGRGGEKP